MKGLAPALRRLHDLPDRAEQAALSSARTASERALQSARSSAPVRTGALRASLTAEPLPCGAALRTACPYALQVERGALRTPARPFLAPAFREANYPALICQALKEAIS